jgi:hypothetical protein
MREDIIVRPPYRERRRQSVAAPRFSNRSMASSTVAEN